MAKRKKQPAPQIEPDPDDSNRIEARLTPLLQAALKNYMRDHHLENRSEVMKSTLGQMLEQEGYLIKTETDYRLTTPEERSAHAGKKIGFHLNAPLRPLSIAAMAALGAGAVRLMLFCPPAFHIISAGVAMM